MKICPLCNGLKTEFLLCPHCEELLEDKGMLEYYFEPYRPYLDEEILQKIDGVESNECLHLFSCPKCGYDVRSIIQRVEQV